MFDQRCWQSIGKYESFLICQQFTTSVAYIVNHNLSYVYNSITYKRRGSRFSKLAVSLSCWMHFTWIKFLCLFFRIYGMPPLGLQETHWHISRCAKCSDPPEFKPCWSEILRNDPPDVPCTRQTGVAMNKGTNEEKNIILMSELFLFWFSW